METDEPPRAEEVEGAPAQHAEPPSAEPPSAEPPSAEPGASPAIEPPAQAQAAIVEAPPAPPSPEPAPSLALDAEPLPDLRPSAARRFIVAPFWAGLLAAGTGFWVGGFYGSLFESRLLEKPSEGVFLFVAVAAALVAALSFGYREPVRSYTALFGRIVGALFFGAMLATVSALIFVGIFESSHPRAATGLLIFCLAGAVMAGLALLRLRGLGPPGPRRTRIAVGAAALLFVSLWPASPGLRCRLGFGEGCREAARAAESDRDIAGYGERGCAHDDLTACYLAGLAYQRGESVRRDPVKAEGLFRTACALGDGESCGRAHALQLARACERFSAVACRDLAAAYGVGVEIDRDRNASARYYRKACLLGADDACAQAGIR